MVYGGGGVWGGGLPLQTLQLLFRNDCLHITVLGVILPLTLQQKQYEGLVYNFS